MSYFSEYVSADNALRADFSAHLVTRILSRVKGGEFPDWLDDVESVFVIRGAYAPKDKRLVANNRILCNVCSLDVRNALEAARLKENGSAVQTFFYEANIAAAKLFSVKVSLESDKANQINYEAKVVIPIKAGFFNDFVAECESAKKEATSSE